MDYPKDLKYTKEHEWARDEGDGRVRVGITDYAQDALGDVVYVDIPETGTEVKAHGERMELEPDQEIAVYRFAQEALSNVVQHADASNVEVDLTSNGNGLELSVRDDGRGFDPDAPRSGVGLIGLAERARMVGAQFEIESSPGRGTALPLQVP